MLPLPPRHASHYYQHYAYAIDYAAIITPLFLLLSFHIYASAAIIVILACRLRRHAHCHCRHYAIMRHHYYITPLLPPPLPLARLRHYAIIAITTLPPLLPF
jgi:hypothetical protein